MSVELTTIEKIRLIASRHSLTFIQIAQSMNTTRQNLSNKISRGDLRESELRQLAEAMGYSLKLSFINKETGEEI